MNLLIIGLIWEFLSYHIWLNPNILSYGDWFFFFHNSSVSWFSHPSLWISQTSFGDINLGISSWPINFTYGLFGKFNYDSNIADKILFFLPILLVSNIGIYILSRKIFSANLSSLIVCFVYTYNTYFILGTSGHLTLMTAFAFAPLVIYFFIRALDEKKVYLSILTGLMAFIVSFYEFRAFYILVWVLFFYFIYHNLTIKIEKKILIKNIILAIIPLFIDFSLNAYWILGLLKVGAVSTNVLFSRGLFGDSYLNIYEALTLFHPFWTGVKPSDFIVEKIPLYFWIIPLFAFLGLYVNKKNKHILFFGFISLFGIFLTKQSGPPFQNLYLFLYNHLPGFNAFREASKFYFLIMLGYSILIVGFIDWLWRNFKHSKFQMYTKYILTIIISLVFLWNCKPIITGELGTLFVPRHIPNDYLLLKDFILKQPEYFRTLWIPTDSRWSIYTNNHPEISAVQNVSSSWDSLTNYNQLGVGYAVENQIVDILKQTYSNNLLDISSIKYVILPIQDKVNDDDFFVYYGSRKYFINQLNKLTFLKKIDINTTELEVFENTNYRPHIYLTNDKETINKTLPYQKVDSHYISPTQYQITLKNISKPIYLNFSESYHPDWTLTLGKFNWFTSILRLENILPNKYHYQNNAKLNSFLIDPATIKKGFSKSNYSINKDGSLNINLTLYFKAQAYIFYGLIVSIATLIACLILLIYFLIKYVKNKK